MQAHSRMATFGMGHQSSADYVSNTTQRTSIRFQGMLLIYIYLNSIAHNTDALFPRPSYYLYVMFLDTLYTIAQFRQSL